MLSQTSSSLYDDVDRFPNIDVSDTSHFSNPFQNIPLTSTALVDELPSRNLPPGDTLDYMKSLLNTHVKSVRRQEGLVRYGSAWSDYFYEPCDRNVPSKISWISMDNKEHIVQFLCYIGGYNKHYRSMSVSTCTYDGIECGDDGFPFIIVFYYSI